MGRSSSKQSSSKLGGGGGMEIDKFQKPKVEEAHHLSGAYIRSLVKQLTSSRTKDTTRKDPDSGNGNKNTMTKIGQQGGFNEPQQQSSPHQQHKKQVRRRLHTSRPYQERLLNMAEARREIVTALKFHRAAMKQANEHKQQQQQQQQQQHASGTVVDPFSNYIDNCSYSTSGVSYTSCASSAGNNPFSWRPSPIVHPDHPTFAENFNLTLPNQTLGLNLNIHHFNNLDASFYHNNTNYDNTSFCLSPSSSSSSPTISISTDMEILPPFVKQEGPPMMVAANSAAAIGGGFFHPALDDDEMAEIRSIGEQHEMEWNDTMNLVSSAWWFKFLKTMEIGPPQDDDGYISPFDQVKEMEFPSWLNANEACLHQHFNDLYSYHYLQEDPALPCMDIGEIDGMDGEWLG